MQSTPQVNRNEAKLLPFGEGAPRACDHIA
jgi:hypothetical protein